MKNLMISIRWFAIALFSIVSIASMAQPPGGGPPSKEKREEIEAMKAAFITRRLDLTPDEAKVFWPVYNQYQGELDKLRESRHQEMKSRDNVDEMPDSELEKIVDGEIAFRQSELDILKKYNSQFKKSLPMRKVAKLYRAEQDFKRELLERIQQRRENNQPNRRSR